MTPPPVVFVTFADPDRSGGVPTTIRSLRSGLTARGHEISVLSHPLTAGVRNTLVRRVWRRVDRSSEEVRRIRRSLESLAERLAAAPKNAVCLAFEAWTAAICCDARRPTIYRVAGLGSITDEWLRNGFVEKGSRHVGWLRETERRGFENADRVVALSSAGRDAIAGLGAVAGNIVVIPNSVALPDPPERGADGEQITVLCVANLRHVKGVDVLAAALAGLPEPLRRRVRLVHAGSGNAPGNPEFEAAQAALTRAGVSHTFRGAIEHGAVMEEMARADLFVLPSRWEMFPNALLEAMASGLPAIASNVGAVPEILGGRAVDDGLVVPPGDAGALGEAIRRSIEDPALRRIHGTANRARVQAEYTIESTVDRYAELVGQVAR